jgi:capsid assembly protease
VFVTKSGGVGSIGVWMMHVDQSEFNKKNGFKPTYLYAGARKIDGNPHEPLTKDARAAFQGEVDRLYAMFVATVARNRSMREDDIEKTEAGLFFGDAAVSAGLADRVGGVNDALAALRDCVKRKKNMNSTSSSVPAAASARIDRERGVSTMDQEKLAAVAEEAPVEEPKEKPAEEEKPEDPKPAEAPLDAAASALAYAADVAEFCVLAGLPGRIVSFLRAKTSVEDVRKELLAARAANEADPIHSHVLPEAGADAGALGLTAKTKVSESPVVQAAERLASAGRKEK